MCFYIKYLKKCTKNKYYRFTIINNDQCLLLFFALSNYLVIVVSLSTSKMIDNVSYDTQTKKPENQFYN